MTSRLTGPLRDRARRISRRPAGAVLLSTAVLWGVSVLAGCGGGGAPAEQEATRAADTQAVGLSVTSAAFAEGERIPVPHTCDGQDLSPPLAWQGVPAAARSLAIICDDPDAPGGTWVHWVVYGIPPETADLPEGIGKGAALPEGAMEGETDFRRPGYGGPCPPPGAPHRYFFKVYALDAMPEPAPPVTKQKLEEAMAGHVLAEGRLVGIYGR